MSNVPDPHAKPAAVPVNPEVEPYDRARVIAARNRVVGLLLGFLVVLFFAITLVKLKI